MPKLPSHKFMIISILLVASVSAVKYSFKRSAQHFQLSFDWEKEKILHDYQEGFVDSISYNYLSISGLKNNFQPDNQNTFSITTSDGKRYFFRYIYKKDVGNSLIFTAVEWITGVPEVQNQKVNLTESDIPLKEKKGKTVVTIGDESLVKDEAKYYRRKIANETELNFLGTEKDVFNYLHFAARENSIEKVNADFESIPTADFYILSWNASQLKQEDLRNLKSFIQAVSKRKTTQKIIVLNAPKVKNTKQNQINQNYNDQISTLSNPKLIILDAFDLFKQERKEYLMPDSVHLNKLGYEKLAHKTVELLK